VFFSQKIKVETGMEEKRVLVLAKTEYMRTPYDKWLIDSGISPIIVTSARFYDGYAENCEHCYCLSNYDSDDTELYALVDKIYQSIPFHYVFCRAEVDVIRSAEIRRKFNIPGQSTNSAIHYRDKLLMKERLSRKNINMANFSEINSADDVISFSEKNQYPFVIKPRLASGSSGVRIIKDHKELNDFIKSNDGNLKGMLAEGFIDGVMYHVDGLFVDGRIRFIQPFKYINDCLSYREDMFIGNVPLEKDDSTYHLLVETTKQIIANMPATENFAFHCELWLTAENEIICCEIASRTGGGMISFLIEEMSGLNIDKAWLLAECHIQTEDYPAYSDEFLRFGCVCIPPARGKLLSLPVVDEKSVRKIHFTGLIGDSYQGGEKSGLYLIGYVIEAKDQSAVIASFKNHFLQVHHSQYWELNVHG